MQNNTSTARDWFCAPSARPGLLKNRPPDLVQLLCVARLDFFPCRWDTENKDEFRLLAPSVSGEDVLPVRCHCSLSFFLIASFSISPCHGTGSWRGASHWYVLSPWRYALMRKSICWSHCAVAISLLSAIHSIASWRCTLGAEAGRGSSGLGANSSHNSNDAVRRLLLANFLVLQPNDTRVGSGRDGSNGGTLSTANGNKTASLSKLGATFAPVAIYLSICLLLFIFLRPRFKRVYAPKTIPSLRYPE